MRLLDLLKNANRESREITELYRLRDRLRRYSGTFEEHRDAIISQVMEAIMTPQDTGEW